MPDSRSLAIALTTAQEDHAESMDITTEAIQAWLTADNLRSGFKALSLDGNWVALVVSESKQETTSKTLLACNTFSTRANTKIEVQPETHSNLIA